MALLVLRGGARHLIDAAMCAGAGSAAQEAAPESQAQILTVTSAMVAEPRYMARKQEARNGRGGGGRPGYG